MGVSRCFKEKILQGALLNQKKVGFKLVHTQLILYCFDHDDHQRVNKAIEYIHLPPPPPTFGFSNSFITLVTSYHSKHRSHVKGLNNNLARRWIKCIPRDCSKSYNNHILNA